MEVADRIRAGGASLTGAERRVAEAILDSPQTVGFGTVAQLARLAGVGAATVVRLATKLGYDGFSELQGSVQRDLMSQLRPAAERIRETADEQRVSHAEVEMGNVRATLEAVDDVALNRVIGRLADLQRPVAILSGDDSAGVAQQFALQLGQIRAGVQSISGSQVSVLRDVATLPDESTLVVIDLRRYERWVLDAHTLATERGLWSVGVTDSVLSPIAAAADLAFDVQAGSVSPFDSHVGTLALLNLWIAGVATALRGPASQRLGAIERAWGQHDALHT